MFDIGDVGAFDTLARFGIGGDDFVTEGAYEAERDRSGTGEAGAEAAAAATAAAASSARC